MRVFVTGGTGTIGSAVIAELLRSRHTVLALARSDTSAEALKSAGAEVLRGALSDLEILRAGAAKSDGVISLAFGRDYSSADALVRSIAEETAALAALGDELRGSERPIVTVSGTPWVPGRASTESDPLPTDGPVGGRGRSVMAFLAQAPRLRSMAVRLPRTVHNEGKGGFAGRTLRTFSPERSFRFSRRSPNGARPITLTARLSRALAEWGEPHAQSVVADSTQLRASSGLPRPARKRAACDDALERLVPTPCTR